MADKRKETTVSSPENVSIQYVVLEQAATEDYILWSVEKIYPQLDFQGKGYTYRTGFNLVPAAGTEICFYTTIGEVELTPDKRPSKGITQKQFEDQLGKLTNILIQNKDHLINNYETEKGTF